MQRQGLFVCILAGYCYVFESIKTLLMQIVPAADVPAKLGTENVQGGHKEDVPSLCSAKILADSHWACAEVMF